LDSHTEGKTQDKGVREQGAERIFEPKVENDSGHWMKLYKKLQDL
jgi:hypothetical protein